MKQQNHSRALYGLVSSCFFYVLDIGYHWSVSLIPCLEDSSAKPKRKGKKQPKTEKNKKLGQNKKSKDPKDQTEEDKEKARKKQEEIERKAEEKRVTDAHKKECRKGEQVPCISLCVAFQIHLCLCKLIRD